jgi:hypothetical protein
MTYAWCWSLAAALALACGNLTNSPHSTPDTSDGGDLNENAPTAGKEAAFGGTSHSNGGTTSAGGVILSTAGTLTDTPNHPDFGGTGAGGEPVYLNDVSLCIYPKDIPANWGVEFVTDDNGHECPVGVLGSFFFMGCPYDLLDVTPHDVDPFTPGHSHCCYKSRLRPCR